MNSQEIIPAWKRRTILLLTEDKYKSIEHTPGKREILGHPEILVYRIDDFYKIKSQYKILGGERPVPDMLLVISPFDDNAYAEVSQAKEIMALEKWLLIINFCQLLGAKSVNQKYTKLYDRDSEKELIIDFTKDIIKGKLSGKKRELRDLSNKMRLSGKFQGTTNRDIEGAEALLNNNNLQGEIIMQNLLASVKASNNPPKLISHEFTLSESVQKTFELTAELLSPISSIGFNYNALVKENIEIKTGLEIEFP